ncbi:MAG: hypothetical protein R2865_15905 [Deinococcales bacterium]
MQSEVRAVDIAKDYLAKRPALRLELLQALREHSLLPEVSGIYSILYRTTGGF